MKSRTLWKFAFLISTINKTRSTAFIPKLGKIGKPELPELFSAFNFQSFGFFPMKAELRDLFSVDIENPNFLKVLLFIELTFWRKSVFWEKVWKILVSLFRWVLELYPSQKQSNYPKLCELFCLNDHVDLCHTMKIGHYGDSSKFFAPLWKYAVLADPQVLEAHFRDAGNLMLKR